jgi:hypothetical protein
MSDPVTVRTVVIHVECTPKEGESPFYFDNLMEGTEIDDAIDGERICTEVRGRLTDGPLHGYEVKVSWT